MPGDEMTLDICERLTAALDRVTDRLLNDLRAIPEADRGACHGGATRTPYAIVIECGVINTRMAAVLERVTLPPPPSPGDYEAMRDHLTTLEDVADFVTHETLVLKLAAQAVAPDGWAATVRLSPTRPPMTRFDAVLLAINHMAYHDGQLNYLHLMRGDDASHW